MSDDRPVDRVLLRGEDETALRARAEVLSPDDQVDEYWAIVHELQRRGTRACFDWALGLVEATDGGRRRLGCDVLAQLGYEDGHPFRDRSVALLLTHLHDADVSVVSAAVSAVGHLAEAGPDVPAGAQAAVLALAGHDDAEVRYAVASALPALVGLDWVPSGDPAVETLIALAADPADDVRSWATFGLGARLKVDGPAVRACLRARLGDPNREVAGEALAGLARRHDRSALDAVAAALGADDVHRSVVEAAGWLTDTSLHEPLRRLAAWWDGDRELLAGAVRRCAPEFVRDSAAQVGALVAAADAVALELTISSELLGQRPEGPMVQRSPGDRVGYGLEPLLRRAGGSAEVAAQLIRTDTDRTPRP
ncbi:MAG: HEAT repeat domain-containing protein [Acidimicrobiales bacterium]